MHGKGEVPARLGAAGCCQVVGVGEVLADAPGGPTEGPQEHAMEGGGSLKGSMGLGWRRRSSGESLGWGVPCLVRSFILWDQGRSKLLRQPTHLDLGREKAPNEGSGHPILILAEPPTPLQALSPSLRTLIWEMSRMTPSHGLLMHEMLVRRAVLGLGWRHLGVSATWVLPERGRG